MSASNISQTAFNISFPNVGYNKEVDSDGTAYTIGSALPAVEVAELTLPKGFYIIYGNLKITAVTDDLTDIFLTITTDDDVGSTPISQEQFISSLLDGSELNLGICFPIVNAGASVKISLQASYTTGTGDLVSDDWKLQVFKLG